MLDTLCTVILCLIAFSLLLALGFCTVYMQPYLPDFLAKSELSYYGRRLFSQMP